MTNDQITWLSLADYPNKLIAKPKSFKYSQTGYNLHAPSDRMIFYKDRWRRIYYSCISNSASHFIRIKGAKLYITD